MAQGLRQLLSDNKKVFIGTGVAVLVIIVVVVAMFAFLGGGDDDGDSDNAADMLAGVSVFDAVAAGGGSCEPSGALDRSNCTLDGVAFSVTESAWAHQAGERQRECDQGRASRQTKVLTNLSWMAYADSERELERVRDILVDHGAPSKVMGYCEWEQS